MTDTADNTPLAGGILGRLVTWWALVGCLLLVAIVLINVWSVVGAWLGMSFAGDFELTEMGAAVAVFTFLPYCQLTGQNVTADIFTASAGPRLVAALTAVGSAIALAFGALLLWRMSYGLIDQKEFGYATTIVQVPLWWAYVPILISLAMLMVAAIATLGRDIRGLR